MKRKVTVTFEIILDKLSNEGVRCVVENQIKDIAPTLVSNVKVDIIYTNK